MKRRSFFLDNPLQRAKLKPPSEPTHPKIVKGIQTVVSMSTEEILTGSPLRSKDSGTDERWAMVERRSHPRVKGSHPVLYFSNIYPKSRVSATVDISLGGTRMETTPFSLSCGEDLDISIAIHPRVIKCRGKVVRVLEVEDRKLTARVRFQAGLRFEGMSKRDRSYLAEHVSHLMEQAN